MGARQRMRDGVYAGSPQLKRHIAPIAKKRVIRMDIVRIGKTFADPLRFGHVAQKLSDGVGNEMLVLPCFFDISDSFPLDHFRTKRNAGITYETR